jgi:tetraacyldisaccharide 4'-kinase
VLNTLERYWRTLVQDRHPTLLGKLAKGALWLSSLGYAAVMKGRNFAYDCGTFKTKRVENTTIVSVGNIVVGGTGKTPLILKLLEDLGAKNTAVLSRGYRSPAEKQTIPTVLSYGHGPLFGACQCGDEPYLIASTFPEAVVVVGRNRYEAAQMAVQAGRKILLLDDGLQHRKIKRNVEIIVVDANDPLGHGYHFPRGYLRESATALSRADMIVVIGHRNVTDVLEKYSAAPIVQMTLDVEAQDFIHKKVGVFCGLAKPEKFLSSLQDASVDMVDTLILSDHQAPEINKLEQFSAQCQQLGAQALLCTEKDRVKLPSSLSSKTSLPIFAVKAKLKVRSGQELWLSLVNRLVSKK